MLRRRADRPPEPPEPVTVLQTETAPEASRAAKAAHPLTLLIVAGALSGWTMVAADACARSGFRYFSLSKHLLGALGMYSSVGALLGVLVAALIYSELALFGRRVQHRPLLNFARPLFYGVVGGLASIGTAIWTFSGEHVQKTTLAVWGPVVFAFALGCAAAVGAGVLIGVLRSLQRGGRSCFIWAALFFAAGVLVARVDLTQYVALYSRVHTILELVASLCWGAAYAILIAYFQRFPAVLRATRAAGGAFGMFLALAVCVPGIRTWFDDSLKHVWLEEVYAGRMLRRLQVAEAFVANPWHWRGMRMARIERLKARYSLAEPVLATPWSKPLSEPREHWEALQRLRGGQSRYNVIVYYVDTLRNDVAADPKIMPGLAAFRRRALDFQRAYAAGSDTLRSLPVLTGGNYDSLDTPENDLLRVAKRAGYDDALAIAKSAYEFLGKLRPDFYFAQNLIVEDYPAQQQVWGYGAQQPTAPRLVDRAIGFLDQPRKQPFFLWLFNFDQHNWRELDADYVDQAAKKYGVTDDASDFPFRYRTVARAIDHEFDRLLQALSARRLEDKTIVLFVSDHGEALGRDGFWVHSVFLWESLIRVPLVLYVPGLEARAIKDKVSLVDVAPTLGRYLDPTLNGEGYHGEDLLSYLLPAPPRRRFPLLLSSASKDLLVRVGLVDPVDEFKLVLSFEAALPELYDLRQKDPDGANFAAEHPARVKRGLELLLGSPVFPRVADDFEVRETRAQKALEPPADEAQP
jgi:hypothetical protein